MATLLAHHFKARPVGVNIETANESTFMRFDVNDLFEYATQETRSLGYALHTSRLRSDSVAKGIIAASAEKGALVV